MPSFYIIDGQVARDVIEASHAQVVERVKQTYLLHERGDTLNPDSYFLRFPDKPEARIIALPAYLGGESGIAGIKWIASFPGNIAHNLPRASAVLLLNDYETGYPFSCLEASTISAARTAASAVLGAEHLNGSRKVASIAIVGAGVIARTIADFFVSQQWQVGEFIIHDHSPTYAQALVDHLHGKDQRARSVTNQDEALAAPLLVFATTAGTPHVHDVSALHPGQVVLNISLRDLSADIIEASHNIVDDVEHCLKSNTSPHLAEQKLGHRRFINGTLAQLIEGKVVLDDSRPKIFSPFGLGILDLAVGLHVHEQALALNRGLAIDNFFAGAQRW